MRRYVWRCRDWLRGLRSCMNFYQRERSSLLKLDLRCCQQKMTDISQLLWPCLLQCTSWLGWISLWKTKTISGSIRINFVSMTMRIHRTSYGMNLLWSLTSCSAAWEHPFPYYDCSSPWNLHGTSWLSCYCMNKIFPGECLLYGR